MAVSLGVGCSTLALIFYFMGMRSDTAHEAGRPYQKVVYIVLRVAMVLILLAEVSKVVLYLSSGVTIQQLWTADDLIFIWTVVAVLFVNPVLMTFHLMPRKLGPAIQATSWYTLGTVTALPALSFTYLPLTLTFLGAILALAVIIELISQKILKRQAVTVTETVIETIIQA